ncbi:hypothetical protein AVEN_106592-1 [Araneus ventricosus]|uniref:Uncharacterized protein n=1 Tax=Araneus ventricosus TaxID=182803 RepID=A0A4Y2IVE4_ARAVE|nr:hypothetical protein AVEN_106592-1 [Araneus ventricosus]
MQEAKRFHTGVVRKLGERVPAQAPPSSSDRGSKLRGLSQNSPRVASKLDVNGCVFCIVCLHLSACNTQFRCNAMSMESSKRKSSMCK